MDKTPQSIKAAFQQITQTMDGKIIEANVIAVSPLTVQAMGDEKLRLAKLFTCCHSMTVKNITYWIGSEQPMSHIGYPRQDTGNEG